MQRRTVTVLMIAFLSMGNLAPAGETFHPHVREAIRYARSRAGTISFAVVDESGRIGGFNRHRRVPSASVIKAMFLAAYLRRPSVRDRRLHDPDRELLAPMIKRSDNEAATRVADIVGPDAMRTLARAAGMKNFSYTRPWGLSQVTARDQARFFFAYDRYIPDMHEKYARYLLSHITPAQRWGVARYVDDNLPGWTLYFKGGWGSGTGWVDHQVAFIESGGRRIAIAIMTRNDPGQSYGNETLRVITRRLLRGLD
jgi:hypothetical protein